MNALYYKIKTPLDIETLSDELSGFDAAVRITETATIEILFEYSIGDRTRSHIDAVMKRLGADPVTV